MLYIALFGVTERILASANTHQACERDRCPPPHIFLIDILFSFDFFHGNASGYAD